MPTIESVRMKRHGAQKHPPATLTLISSLSKASRSDMDLGACDVGVTLAGVAVDISLYLIVGRFQCPEVLTRWWPFESKR